MYRIILLQSLVYYRVILYLCIVITICCRKYNKNDSIIQKYMTLKELYNKAKEQPRPDTPANVFVRKVAGKGARV